jgi:beta-mannosidase
VTRWILLAAAALPLPALAAPKTVVTLDRGWQLRIDPADARAHPIAAAWRAATVPGSVQSDLVAHGSVPDPYKGTNEAAIQWVGLSGWQYRTTLEATAAMLARDHLDLVFDGLDTFADVRVNGAPLLSSDNAHRRWRIDAKRALRLGANEILVTLKSPIRTLQPMVLAQKNPLPGEYDSAFGDEPKGRQTSPYIRKPKYHYGWDWGPRIVTIGVSGAVRLEAWDDARIATLRIEQEALTDAEARLSARLDVAGDTARRIDVRIDVTGPDGRRIRAVRQVAVAGGANAVSVPINIARPQRWQPVGYGTQPLYTVTATLMDRGKAIDSATRRTGLRTVELIRDQGGFGFRINGTPVFAKGANLIPFDTFANRVTPAQMRTVLQGARDANMNMIRVWGGGYYLDDAFYDTADAMGLMIWQDFMFGGAVTPPDAAFRDTVRVEAEQQVARLQAHPSIVLWAGGNEVLSGWENWSDRKAFKLAVGANEQERIGAGMAVLFDRTLRQAVTVNDPDVPYWPGSPSTDYDGPVDTDAQGDRHFWDVWSGSKPIERYTDSCPRFMSEYGFQGMPDLATIRDFAGPGALSANSAVMKAHQKFLAGEGNDRILFYLKQYYRAPRDFADLVYLSQAMQADAIRLGALHHRACRPVTMGSLYWQINDVWPAVSWSSIDWYGRWKLLHYAARRFYAPQAIVAEHKDGATRIALVSDATRPIAARWRWRAMDMAGRVLKESSAAVTLPPLSAGDAATLSDAGMFGTADPKASFAVAELLIDDRTVSRAIVERLAPKDMAYPAPGLTARWDGKRVTITAARLARAVMLDFGEVAAQPAEDGFDLLPGESIAIDVTSDAAPATLATALHLRTLGPEDIR